MLAPRRVERQRAQCLGERERVAGRDQQAVEAIARDIPVAGNIRGDDRRACGKRLGEHHPEALPAQRRRAQHLGTSQLGVLALL